MELIKFLAPIKRNPTSIVRNFPVSVISTGSRRFFGEANISKDFSKHFKNNFSELMQLSSEHLNDCEDLQKRMLQMMHHNRSNFDFVRKRSREEFKTALENRELYGVFERQLLIGIILIKGEENKKLLEHLDGKNGAQIVSPNIKKLLAGKGAYLTSFMSDLNPNRKGLGNYILRNAVSLMQHKLGYDFFVGEIHVNNAASFNSANNSGGKSFAVSHKVVSFVNAKGLPVGAPVFYNVTLFEKNTREILDRVILRNTEKDVTYGDREILQIFDSFKLGKDPIISEDQIIIFIDRQPKIVNFDNQKLEELISGLIEDSKKGKQSDTQSFKEDSKSDDSESKETFVEKLSAREGKSTASKGKISL